MSIIAAPVSSAVEAAAQLRADYAARSPFIAAVTGNVDVFLTHESRPPDVLVLGALDGELVRVLRQYGCAVTVVSPDPAELERCRWAADGPGCRLLCKSPLQLPGSERYDMLVLNLFGGTLNAKGAALYAADLHRRKVIKVFEHNAETLRYVVPVAGTMTVRLCYITGVDIGLARRPGAAVAFRPHTAFGGLGPLVPDSNTFGGSRRVDVLHEDYERGTTEWPAEIRLELDRAYHRAPTEQTALVLEWTLALSRDGGKQWSTAVGAPGDRARVLAWPNMLAPTVEWRDEPTLPERPLHFRVLCKPAGKVELATVPEGTKFTEKTKTYTDARLETMVDATYAAAVKHELKQALTPSEDASA